MYVPYVLGAAIAGGIGGVVFILSAIFGLCLWSKRKNQAANSETKLGQDLEMGKRSTLTRAPEVDTNDIQLGEVLGKGQFGEVRRGVHLGQDVAVKMLRQVTAESEAEFQKEIGLNGLLPKHGHVVQMLAVATGSMTGIIMELYPLGSLEDHLKRIKRGECKELTFPEAIQLLIDICSGIMCLHSCNVVHR